MNKTLAKQSDSRIDLIRGIAIMGVVGIHYGGSFFLKKEYVWSGPFYMGLFLNEISSFAVPAFVFLSGWALESHYGAGPVNYRSFYRRRLSKIGIPYFIVSWMWFNILKGQPPFMGKGLFPLFFYYGIQPTLFFIPLIMQLYILYPLFHYLLKKSDRDHGKENGVCSIGSFILLAVMLVIHLSIGYLSYTNKIDYLTYCRPFAPFWAFYFVAGIYCIRIRKILINNKYIIKLFVILLIAIMVIAVIDAWSLMDINRVGALFERTDVYYAYSRPLIMAYNIICLMLIALILSSKISLKILPVEWFGRSSLYIYLLHLIILGRYVWGRPDVTEACKKYPALMLLVIVVVCAAIAIPVQFLAVIVRVIRPRLAGYVNALRGGFDK